MDEFWTIFVLGEIYMNVIGYCRVSTDKQANDGLSLDMQAARIKEYLEMKDHDKTYHLEIITDDGYSGSNLNRPGIQKMMNIIKKRKTDLIIAYDLARLTRSLKDTVFLLDLLSSYNIQVKCLFDSVSQDTASERFSTHMRAVNNEYERDKVSERTLSTLRSIVVNKGRYPHGGRTPFGYKRDKEKNLIINQDEENYVQLLFHKIAQNVPILSVCRELNDSYPDKRFYPQKVKNIVKDRKYSGHFTYKGISYENIVPAIISEDLQQKAIAALIKHSSKQNDKYVFDNILECSCCHEILKCHSSYNSKKEQYYYYKCKKCNSYFPQNRLLEELSTYQFNLEPEQSRILLDSIKKDNYRLNRKAKAIKEKYVSNSLEEKEYLMLMLPLEEEINKNENIIKFNSIQDDEFILSGNTSLGRKKLFIQQHIKKIIVNKKSKKIEKIIFKI